MSGKPRIGAVLAGDDRLVVVSDADAATPESALAAFVLAVRDMEVDPADGRLAAHVGRVRTRTLFSCLAWQEYEENWWSEDGAGSRAITVASYDGDLDGLVADLAGAPA